MGCERATQSEFNVTERNGPGSVSQIFVLIFFSARPRAARLPSETLARNLRAICTLSATVHGRLPFFAGHLPTAFSSALARCSTARRGRGKLKFGEQIETMSLLLSNASDQRFPYECRAAYRDGRDAYEPSS